VHIWDAADGGLVMSVPAHRSAVREIAAPPQGDVLVSSAGTARAWHVPCDLRRAAPADPPTAANEGRATSASARGGAVASASATVEDGVVRVRDGDVIRLTLPAPPGESVTAVLLLGSGRELVTGGSEGTIRVWDAMHGELRAELRGHRAPVARLSIDDSEGRLVSADASGIVRLWPAPRDEGVMDDLERAEPEPERP
jgi:WD40 repeat protein